MKEDDQPKTNDEKPKPNDEKPKPNDEKPLGLTVYKPEDQAFQKLHLCEYLRELYEAVEEENEHSAEKKRN